MAEKKVKVQIPGQAGPVDAVEVSVAESTERWTEVQLEDGTVLRLKPVVVGALRVEGQYDQDGNPVYSLKVNQIMIVGSSPEHLRKGGSPEKKEVH